ncbi:glycosyltransferase family 2 protein [Capnocytophaga cynodegmi]|uniref:glycosyltransferase family 2 protein n=1 Tax=Capnocytophaga cynodegmi TaxID=28189 RepID=UPI003859D036
MTPKVSILVPVYGVAQFIERCAISLFEQTFVDIEYIFINDCTPDNSITILERVITRYPHRKPKVKIIQHKNNRGLAAARNTGVQNAIGEYILHVDSDDCLEVNMVELLYNKAIQEDADLVFCDYILDFKNSSKKVEQVWDSDKQEFIKRILSASSAPSIWNKLSKKSLYTDYGIQAIEGINLGEDFLVVPKLLYHSKKVAKVSEFLYHYNLTNPNSYTKDYSKKNIDNVITVLNDLTLFFKKKADYKLYETSILQGKLKKKVEFLLNGDKRYWNDLILIFPETNNLEDISFLCTTEKIGYFFIKYNLKQTLYFYKWIYRKYIQWIVMKNGNIY